MSVLFYHSVHSSLQPGCPTTTITRVFLGHQQSPVASCYLPSCVSPLHYLAIVNTVNNSLSLEISSFKSLSFQLPTSQFLFSILSWVIFLNQTSDIYVLFRFNFWLCATLLSTSHCNEFPQIYVIHCYILHANNKTRFGSDM